MFSQTAEYALRAMVWLANQDGEPRVTQEIAKGTHVPAGYLSKVLQTLGRAGLVQSQRGLHGGFLLSRPGAAITVLDVVNAVDPLKRISSCPLKIKSHGEHLCALHRRMDNAIAQVEQALAATSIADILAEPSRSRPLTL
ncbi:MAG: Rrf2 family transcriptional regulator [Lentisphaerae bacterium]|nr:Rrf2 family transcriptional regulator [Lentisphaerota bacterium]